MKKTIIITLILLVLFILLYTILLYKNKENTIVIGTKNFTEQKIIGYILEDVIESQTDYNVKVLPGIGETSFLQTAMIKGDIDIYVDYTSTAYTTVLGHDYNGESSEEIYNQVNSEYKDLYDINWISLLGFENSNAVLCSEFCKNNNITKLSQLKDYNDLTFGAPVEFFTRTDGLPLLEDVYGFKISNENQIALDHALIYPSLNNNEIDLALGYTTDGQLYNSDITVLEDDLNTFPKYDAGIVVSQQVLKEYSELENILIKFNQSIDVKTMQELNYKVDVLGENPEDVAHEESEKLLLSYK